MKFYIFVSTVDITPNRIAWCRETLEAFSAEPALSITVIDAGSAPEQRLWFSCKGLKVVEQPFEGSVHRRFLLAEALAQSEYFLVSDNDILPTREGWLSAGLEIMRRHPKLGWCCYRLENTDFEHDHQYQDTDIRSIAWGGGLSIIKRDARQHPFTVPLVFNPQSADDKEYCAAIRRSGYGVAMFQNLYVKHIGQSESSAWGRTRLGN